MAILALSPPGVPSVAFSFHVAFTPKTESPGHRIPISVLGQHLPGKNDRCIMRKEYTWEPPSAFCDRSAASVVPYVPWLRFLGPTDTWCCRSVLLLSAGLIFWTTGWCGGTKKGNRLKTEQQARAKKKCSGRSGRSYSSAFSYTGPSRVKPFAPVLDNGPGDQSRVPWCENRNCMHYQLTAQHHLTQCDDDI